MLAYVTEDGLNMLHLMNNRVEISSPSQIIT